MTFPRIMGVVNVTPDSFSDGGQFISPAQAVDHALRLIDQGADQLDIGGESTRPGAEGIVPVDEEMHRVIPVIEGIRRVHADFPISIDTRKAIVAEAALESGATMVNDVTAGRHDQAVFAVAARHRVPFVVMHMQGTPGTMQDSPAYTDVVAEVHDFLRERVDAARSAGIDTVYVDVGIGFGKTLEHNLSLLRNLGRFNDLGDGQVLGISRKRFLGAITGITEPRERDESTALMHALLANVPVYMIRVHNVELIGRLRALVRSLNGD